MGLRRMSVSELDEAAVRLQELELQVEGLREKLKVQVDNFGSTPPRAEKSKRLVGNEYRFTLSTSTTVEIKEMEVERIAESCPAQIFDKLFRSTKKWKLCDGASLILAGTLPLQAPRNLRQMFERAVTIKEGQPRLRVEKLNQEACVSS